MIGTGIEMRLDPCAQGLLVAPREHRIDESIAAAVLEIRKGIAEAQPHIPVVRQIEIKRDHSPPDCTGNGTVLGQTDALKRAEPRIGPENHA